MGSEKQSTESLLDPERRRTRELLDIFSTWPDCKIRLVSWEELEARIPVESRSSLEQLKQLTKQCMEEGLLCRFEELGTQFKMDGLTRRGFKRLNDEQDMTSQERWFDKTGYRITWWIGYFFKLIFHK